MFARKLNCIKNIIVAGAVVNGVIVYKSYQKFSKLKDSLDKFVWFSQETLMPSKDDFDYDLVGTAFSSVSLDLTDALDGDDAHFDIISDYSNILIKVKSGTQVKLNGDSKYSRAKVLQEADSKLFTQTLEINYALAYSNLVVEVIS